MNQNAEGQKQLKQKQGISDNYKAVTRFQKSVASTEMRNSAILLNIEPWKCLVEEKASLAREDFAS